MDEVNQPAHYTSGGIKTDRELLQQSLNVLRHLCLHSRAVIGYDGEQVQAGIDALKARLAQPEPVIQARKEGDLIVVDLPQVPRGSGGISKREWVGLTLDEIYDSTHGFTRIQKDDWVATDTDIAEFAHIIEARLKAKNT